jgi:hypothetical protein
MEHVIARRIWGKNDWLFEGQHGFRPGYLCESQVITVCQDVIDSLDNGISIDSVIIDFFEGCRFSFHDRLLTKISALGVDSRVVVWIREFHLGRTQIVRVGG